MTHGYVEIKRIKQNARNRLREQKAARSAKRRHYLACAGAVSLALLMLITLSYFGAHIIIAYWRGLIHL